MKRVFLLVLAIFILCLSGCTPNRTDITREELIAAYEAAGYHVWTDTYDEKLDCGEIGYVQANHPDGDYIYFAFFETEEEAKAYKKELDHPGWKFLFSAIFGDPSWERMEVYGCICVSYDEPDFFTPFKELLKGNEKGS